MNKKQMTWLVLLSSMLLSDNFTADAEFIEPHMVLLSEQSLTVDSSDEESTEDIKNMREFQIPMLQDVTKIDSDFNDSNLSSPAEKNVSSTPRGIKTGKLYQAPYSYDTESKVLTIGPGGEVRGSVYGSNDNHFVLEGVSDAIKVVVLPGVYVTQIEGSSWAPSYNGVQVFSNKNLPNLQEVEGLGNLDTSRIKNFGGIFDNQKNLSGDLNFNVLNYSNADLYNTNVNLSPFAHLVNGVVVNGNLDVSGLPISKSRSLTKMFENVEVKGEIINLPNFDVSNTEAHAWMFKNATVPHLDVSNWRPSKTTSLLGMFSGTKTDYIDISQWNTPNAINANSMFSHSNIETLNVGNYRYPKTINKSMFLSELGSRALILGPSFNLKESGLSSVNPRRNQGIYSDGWFRVDVPEGDTAPKYYKNDTDFVNGYNGYQAGKWIWGRNINLNIEEETVLAINEGWDPADNFVSASDEMGKEYTEMNDIKDDLNIEYLDGHVNSSIPGATYRVKYTYTGPLEKSQQISKIATITIKEAEPIALNVTDSTIPFGSSWNPADNFVSAIDEGGTSADFSKIFNIEYPDGEINTKKSGATYRVVYYYKGALEGTAEISRTATVTIGQGKIPTVDVKDSEVEIGADWNPVDNFVKATDELGEDVTDINGLKSITYPDGEVNTKVPGASYKVKYIYESKYDKKIVEAIAIVKVKDVLPLTLEVKDSEIEYGSKWEPKDNFVKATNEKGDVVTDVAKIAEITYPDGEVNTRKPGKYRVIYVYKGDYKTGPETKTAVVTVKESDNGDVSVKYVDEDGEEIFKKREFKDVPIADEMDLTDPSNNVVKDIEDIVKDKNYELKTRPDNETAVVPSPEGNTVTYVFKGLIKLKSVTPELTFEKGQINSKTQKLGYESQEDFKIEVDDYRQSKGTPNDPSKGLRGEFKMQVELTEPFKHSVNSSLLAEAVLQYDGKNIDLNNPIEIVQSTQNSKKNYEFKLDEKGKNSNPTKGWSLTVPPKNVQKGTYEADLTWTLVEGP